MTPIEQKELFSKARMVTYSPAIFFIALLVGVVIHINFPTPFIPVFWGWVVGVILLLISPVLSIWSLRLRPVLYIPVEEQTCFNFNVGPYRISRHPADLGFLLLVVGFAFIINSLIMILLGVILFVLFTAFIIPEEEHELEKRCGEAYSDYKKHVRMWI